MYGGSGGGGGGKPDVPMLRPGDLFDKRKQRDAARLKAYNTILEQIYTRIKTASKQGSDPWIVYSLPPFLIGMPRIDLEDACIFIIFMLRQQQYEVRYTYPNLIYISWKHHEKNYLLNTSPIMQTMLAAAQSSKPKNELKKGGTAQVRFQEQVVQHTFQPGSPTGGQRSARAPPRSTANYTPPTSFLNALEQPMTEPRADVLKDFLNF